MAEYAYADVVSAPVSQLQLLKLSAVQWRTRLHGKVRIGEASGNLRPRLQREASDHCIGA